MSRARSIILENDNDELGGVDPKDYADQTINEPPEYTQALEDMLDHFGEQVRKDFIRLLRDGLHKSLTGSSWQRRFPRSMFPNGYGKLIARAVLTRAAERNSKSSLSDPMVKSMRRVVDDWLRFT